MADIEKVKRGIKAHEKHDCRSCPFAIPCAMRDPRIDPDYSTNILEDIRKCRDELITDMTELIAELEERIAIMEEPVEKKWYPKSRMWECQGCGDVVRGIDKYCSHCGRKFIEEECEDE